jgi:membrane associated rhomboid family serine protease
MPDTVEPTHESLLRLCAAAAPKPWYPRVYAQSSGVNRDSLDIPLNDLRLSGMIQLTDWEPGTGQGYILTDLGKEVLQNSTIMDQLRASLPVAAIEPPPVVEVPAEQEAPTTFQRGEVARYSYYLPEPPRVMPVLLILNLLAFGLTFIQAIRLQRPLNDFIFKGDPIVLHSVGALSAPDLVYDEWWRLITNCFLHFGLIHLALNMCALYVLGDLESLWGGPRFLIIYFLSGLGGSCAAMIFTPTAMIAGASGAIWGLMISFFAWLLLNRRHLPPQEIQERLRHYGSVIFLNLLVSTLPNISISAHLGGGFIGCILAVLLFYHRFSVGPRRTGFALLVVLVPFLCVGALLETMALSSQWQQIRTVSELLRAGGITGN